MHDGLATRWIHACFPSLVHSSSVTTETRAWEWRFGLWVLKWIEKPICIQRNRTGNVGLQVCYPLQKWINQLSSFIILPGPQCGLEWIHHYIHEIIPFCDGRSNWRCFLVWKRLGSVAPQAVLRSKKNRVSAKNNCWTHTPPNSPQRQWSSVTQEDSPGHPFSRVILDTSKLKQNGERLRNKQLHRTHIPGIFCCAFGCVRPVIFNDICSSGFF